MSASERRASERRPAGIIRGIALGLVLAAAAGAPGFVRGSFSAALASGYDTRASAASAAGQTALPGDGFRPGWKKSSPQRTFISQDLFNHIDGGAELFLEFGFAKLLVQTYGNGPSELTAAVYEMESATAALGVYLMKMGKESPFPEIGARNSSEDAQLTIVKGKYFVQVDNFGDPPAARVEAVGLANSILTGIAADRPEPIIERLPVENRVPGSERLIRGPYGLQPYFTFGEGDVLQMGGKIFGALAEYRAADGSVYTRLIIPYPDATAAAAAYENLKTNLDAYLKIVETKPDGFSFVDFQIKYGRVALAGNVLDVRFKMSGLELR